VKKSFNIQELLHCNSKHATNFFMCTNVNVFFAAWLWVLCSDVCEFQVHVPSFSSFRYFWTWSLEMFILHFFKHLWFLCFFYFNLIVFCDEATALCAPWTLEIFCTHWEWLSSSLNPYKHFEKQMICHGCQCHGVHSFECLFMTCNILIPKLLI